jgi:PAS domain S-box-containing protein
VTAKHRASSVLPAGIETILAKGPIAIMVIDSEGVIRSLTGSARRVLDCEEQDLIGKHWRTIWTKASAEQNEEIWAQIQRGSGPDHGLTEIRATSGDTRICEWWTSEQRHTAGRLDSLSIAFLDVTDRVRAEREREQALEDFRIQTDALSALTEVTANAVSTLDLPVLLETLIQRVVRIMKANSGFLLLSMNSHMQVQAVAGADAKWVGFTYPASEFATGRAVRTGGTVIWNADQSSEPPSPFVEGAGIRTFVAVPLKRNSQVIGILHVDWTEHRLLLKRELHMLEITAERATAAILNARLYQASQRREQIHGFMADLRGLETRQAVFLRTVEALNEIFRPSLGGVFLLNGEDLVLAEGSNWPAASGQFTLSINEGSAPAFAIRQRATVVSPDYRQEKRFEPNQRMMNEFGVRSAIAVPCIHGEKCFGAIAFAFSAVRYFEPAEIGAFETIGNAFAEALRRVDLAKVADRAKLETSRAQEQLMQMDKLALVGELLSGVAHELNNPLSILLGHAALLREQPEVTPALVSRIEKIEIAARRASGIVHNFLSFVRKRDRMRTAVNLSALIDQVVSLRSYYWRNQNIEVNINIRPGTDNVVADFGEIQQVLLNLLKNAEDAIRGVRESGKIAVTVSNLGADMVRMRVEDDGPGISDDVSERIFEPFVTTKPTDKGTGLGLSISKRIVEEYSGTLSVESSPLGAAFNIDLPAIGAISADTEGIRVLVVDDELEMLQVCEDVLMSEKYQVLQASTVDQALDILSGESVDLIITDLHFAGSTGRGLFTEAVGAHLHPGERFIIMTGGLLDPDQMTWVQQNHLVVLEKPFPPERLRDAVRKVLQ